MDDEIPRTHTESFVEQSMVFYTHELHETLTFSSMPFDMVRYGHER